MTYPKLKQPDPETLTLIAEWDTTPWFNEGALRASLANTSSHRLLFKDDQGNYWSAYRQRDTGQVDSHYYRADPEGYWPACFEAHRPKDVKDDRH